MIEFIWKSMTVIVVITTYLFKSSSEIRLLGNGTELVNKHFHVK